MINKNDNVKKESIGNGVSIFTSQQHSFGTDAVLLANFASPKRSDKAIDLGTGCGIIPFLWARYDNPETIHCVEIQPNAKELIDMSKEANDRCKRVMLYSCDLREIEKQDIELYSYSLVTMNPPYKPVATGFESNDASHKIARHEKECTLEDVCICADKLLKFGGRLDICMRPERLADIIYYFRKHDLEAKKIRFVSGKSGKEPFLVLVEGRKGGNKGLRVLPELIVRNADGSFTEEMIEIYGDYGDGTR